MLRCPEERLCTFNLFSEADEEDLRDVVYERLMDPLRFETDPQTDCMIYLGAWTECGVGRVRVGQRVYNVVRVAAWCFLAEPLWSDRVPYHRCDSPACFNPDHIGIAPNRSIAYALRTYDSLSRSRRLAKQKPRLRPRQAEDLRAAAERGTPARDLATTTGLTELEILAFFASDQQRSQPPRTHGFSSQGDGGSARRAA